MRDKSFSICKGKANYTEHPVRQRRGTSRLSRRMKVSVTNRSFLASDCTHRENHYLNIMLCLWNIYVIVSGQKCISVVHWIGNTSWILTLSYQGRYLLLHCVIGLRSFSSFITWLQAKNTVFGSCFSLWLPPPFFRRKHNYCCYGNKCNSVKMWVKTILGRQRCTKKNHICCLSSPGEGFSSSLLLLTSITICCLK